MEFKVLFSYQGKQIHPNGSDGVIAQNQTLIISKVDRRWTGLLTCVASNDEGDGESNALSIHVRCKLISLQPKSNINFDELME